MMINNTARTVIYELVRAVRDAEAALRTARSDAERQRWTKTVQNYREAIKVLGRLENQEIASESH
jgi:hypothetical protein